MRFALPLLCLGLGFELLACGDNSTTTTTIDRPELVAVQPSDFLGQFRCDAEGKPSYVATLFDVTPDAEGRVPDPGIVVSSSPATSCIVPVTFSSVRPNRRYVAVIEGYDVAASELAPLASGARIQTIDTKPVTPSWTATCGGYPPSPNPDGGVYPGLAGAPGSTGSAGASGSLTDEPPGVLSYPGVTQTPHNCVPGSRR